LPEEQPCPDTLQSRHREDRAFNSNKYRVLFPDGTEGQMASVGMQCSIATARADRCADLKAGNVVRVEENQFMPADMVLLWSPSEEGICYLETANLDGFAFFYEPTSNLSVF
jgi:hypothetical protein